MFTIDNNFTSEWVQGTKFDSVFKNALKLFSFTWNLEDQQQCYEFTEIETRKFSVIIIYGLGEVCIQNNIISWEEAEHEVSE